MVVIVDFISMQRVLVDGLGNFPRVIYPLRRLTLTKLRLPVLRGARTGTLVKAKAKFDLDKKVKELKAFQKIERYQTRLDLTDSQRFEVMVKRRQRSFAAKHPNLGKGKAKAAAGKAEKKPAAAAKAAPADKKAAKGKK